jgi:glycosyltransferase involved in cell wall biosynthesis
MLRLAPEQVAGQRLQRAKPEARVLAVNRVGFLGGVERVLLTAASVVQPLGWPTLIVCPPGDLAEEARGRGLRVHETAICSLSLSELRRRGLGAAGTLGQLLRSRQEIAALAERCGSSVLHAHHPAGVLQAGWAARRLGLPLIWHVHETLPMPQAYRLLARQIASACRLFICVSRASREMLDEFGVPRERVRLIYNAVDPQFLGPAPAARPLKGGPHIGVFGVLEPRKGQGDLIRACASLTKAWPDLQLWIVGGESYARSAPYRASLERLAADLGFAGAHFTGRRSDIAELMMQMDVVVSSSVVAESLPTVLLEASALGRPVLTTDVGGAREIVRDGETGRVVPPGEPETLAQALAEMLRGQAQKLGEQARVSARLRFSPQGFARSLAEAYRELEAESIAR